MIEVSISTEDNRQDTTLRAQVQNKLRNAILDGQFKARQKLVERELCELTGASRSILREALINLEANGLIERESYRGFSVTQISARKVKEIFELRTTLETMAAELFTERASEQELDTLRNVLAELEQGMALPDLGKIRAAKMRFYDVLFTGCRNVEIRRALENVIDRIYYLRSRSMMDSDRRVASLNEMRRLTTALMNRDQLEARAASFAHLTAAQDIALKILAENRKE